jgi:hypothetical protein
LAKIAQLLVVVEKLSFFESAILKKFCQKKYFFLLHSYLSQSQINEVAWMGLNFYDDHDFQKNQGGYRIMKHTVLPIADKIALMTKV